MITVDSQQSAVNSRQLAVPEHRFNLSGQAGSRYKVERGEARLARFEQQA